jgi:hypothetical protein
MPGSTTTRREPAGRAGGQADRLRTPVGIAARPVLLAGLAALLAVGCAPASGSNSSPGPLGRPGSSGICQTPSPGQIFTDGMPIDTNHSSHAVRITAVWLTSTRHVITSGLYADVIGDGGGTLGDADGYPPPALRHRARGTVVPAGQSVQFLFTVTATGPGAYVGGETIAYSSGGQSWTQADHWFLGRSRHCP